SVRCPPRTDRHVRATRYPFYRSARPADVPPKYRRRPGRRGRGRACHRSAATGAARRPGPAIPRRTLDDPDRPHTIASGRRPGVPHPTRLRASLLPLAPVLDESLNRARKLALWAFLLRCRHAPPHAEQTTGIGG